MDAGILGTLFVVLVVLQLVSMVGYHLGHRALGLICVFGPVAAVLAGVISLGVVAAAEDLLLGASVAVLGTWLLCVWLIAIRRTWTMAHAPRDDERPPDDGRDVVATLDQDGLVAQAIVPVLAAVLGVASLLVWGVSLVH